MQSLKEAAATYMLEVLAYDASIVRTIERDGHALVTFDNGMALFLRQTYCNPVRNGVWSLTWGVKRVVRARPLPNAMNDA